MPQTAGDILVQTLTEWGIDTIFGLPGDGVNGIIEALRKRTDDVRFSLAFSSSSDLNRLASDTSMPPYLAFHL
jgi:hypothetical protein